jgi:hypothetical protein
MVIAVDFDGTCVTHEFPKIGMDIGAQKVLKRLVWAGHKLILYTMRSGDSLYEAECWFKDNGIHLYGIQTNPTQKDWTTSPKCYAELYIDDAALGCPLIHPIPPSERSFVDWEEIEQMLKQKGVIE